MMRLNKNFGKLETHGDKFGVKWDSLEYYQDKIFQELKMEPLGLLQILGQKRIFLVENLEMDVKILKHMKIHISKLLVIDKI